jgi:hypothetical protein
MSERPSCPVCGRERNSPQTDARESDDCEEALEQCDRILELCHELPDRRSAQIEELVEEVQAIREMVERTWHLTARQQDKLDHLEDMLLRWTR